MISSPLSRAIVSTYAKLLPVAAATTRRLRGHGSAARKPISPKPVAERMRGEVLPTKEVEALWTRKLKGFRVRILAIPERLRDFNARQSVRLSQELRGALHELADGQ